MSLCWDDYDMSIEVLYNADREKPFTVEHMVEGRDDEEGGATLELTLYEVLDLMGRLEAKLLDVKFADYKGEGSLNTNTDGHDI